MSTFHESSSSGSPFLRRFDALWARLRRVQFGESLVVWGLILLVAWIALIAADFWLELSRSVRTAGIIIAVALASLWAYLLWRQFRRAGTRPRTAQEIERSFPQLGQSIRTTVQFGEATVDQVRSAGVREALVSALEEETHARSRGLHLDAIVPTQRMWWIAAGLGAAVAALLGAMALNWEIRTAAARSLLSETPYSEVSVRPGNIKVDQGQPVEIEWTIAGRTDREIRLLTRYAGDPQGTWSQRDFTENQATGHGHRSLTFTTRLESVKKPLEYRVAAGPLESPIHRIDVRYPIALQQFEVELTPPAYTNHPPTKSEDPNITAVEGSSARFLITLDQPARTASLVVNDLGRRDDDEMIPTTRTIPLEIEGTQLTAVLPLTGDMKYSIVAETSEGQRLPENSYRIRVRPDQAPEVYFEEPGDQLDVHTLAEILMRIRVRDDFGLSRAGIIFEVNNEEEYPLLSEDFATAAEELQKLGKLTPDTQAALEKVLPLEFFQLKMTDSVAYYAFVEDNYPGRPHRSVTDLRFIDIRPFRIRYSVRDDDPVGGSSSPGPKIATLEEIIKRQRFNLNRSMTVARRAERMEKIDLSQIDALVTSETEIAQATRQLADYFGGLMIEELADEIQLLLQAEANMLAAADSLSAGKYDTAVLQERDALKELIEGRNRLRMAIQKNPARFRSLGAADRRMAQKLRRPKSDKQEAEEVARRLKQLASSQEEIESALSSQQEHGETGSGTGDQPPQTGSAEQPTPMPPAGEKNEARNSNGPDTGEDAGKKASKPLATEPEKAQAPGSPMKAENEATLATETPEVPAESSKRMSREELRDRQLDNVLEAQDLELALGKLKNVTDLAKQRMTDAKRSLEGASASLEKGDTRGAIAESDRASRMLLELARQVKALSRAEAAERLDEARKLAAELAREQQELAAASGRSGEEGERDEGKNPPQSPMPGQKGGTDSKDGTPPTGSPGKGSSKRSEERTDEDAAGSGSAEPAPGNEPGSGRGQRQAPQAVEKTGNGSSSSPSSDEEESARGEALAHEAERNAEAGKTVADILQSILKSTDPADKDVISKLEGVLKETGLDETVSRMEGLAGQLRDGRLRDAQVTAADSADRWEAMANRLTTAFREISAPRLEDLLDLEKKLQTLQDQLNNLQNEREAMEWHIATGNLLKKIEELNVDSEGIRKKLEELMKEAGWSEEVNAFRLRGAAWVFDREKQAIVPPEGYGMALREVSREVQAHIQELLLGDLVGSRDNVTPPQYAALVERYYEILAKQKRPEAK